MTNKFGYEFKTPIFQNNFLYQYSLQVRTILVSKYVSISKLLVMYLTIYVYALECKHT